MKREIRTALIVMSCLAITGCDNALFDDGIRKAVREKLKDPDSAKFGKPIIFKNRGCIEINSKNSYGGYAGASIAHLKNIGGDAWSVETLEGRSCFETVLQELQKKDEAEDKFEKELLARLKKRGDAKGTDTHLYLTNDDNKCVKFARGIHASFRLSQDEKNDKERKRLYEDRVAKELALLDTGNCSD